jgi:surfeit locus 1 family protein
LWQLARLEERRSTNEIGQARISADPVPLIELLTTANGDLDSLEYRSVTVAGVWDVTEEVLIRSQVERGNAGFHVITPLLTDEGPAVLVNRGWVPLTLDTTPVDQASPPSAQAEVEGWVHLTQLRPPFGPEEPEGDLDVFNRVDIDRIASQMPYPVAPVYAVAVGESDEQLPIPDDPPDFTDEGPHLSYAIQWFAFAVIGLVGFFFLLRRKAAQGR